MKKAIFLFISLSLLLIGCSNNNTEQSVAAENQSDTTNSSNTIPSYYNDYILNPQVSDDRFIQDVGESFRDKRGELTLQAIKNDSQTYKIDSIELTIREAKILHFKPDYGLIDFFHSYTHDEEFDFVKMFAEIKNTSDTPLKFAPAAIVSTSSGEKKTWEDDIYLEELNGEIGANETKKGNVGFIIKKSKIDFIEITTSDVFNEKEEKISDAEKVKLEF
ncbi:hypothetical protein D1953_01600 [Peribacillus asahii]|uniref:DUF4352 domain-containing protein n=1 Tax=Peribacillus asahii TaxID=228899 RepID=A0A398BI74_9BACI|nr:hypothetical protein [Peribacillus asahii]RID89287.1 hypothetical protein D1953_01600 [Peribacillus asahii]